MYSSVLTDSINSVRISRGAGGQGGRRGRGGRGGLEVGQRVVRVDGGRHAVDAAQQLAAHQRHHAAQRAGDTKYASFEATLKIVPRMVLTVRILYENHWASFWPQLNHNEIFFENQLL